MSPRDQTTQFVISIMSTFPRIIGTINDINHTIPPLPSDAEIYDDHEQILASMLAQLQSIQPAPSGKISTDEATIQGWLNSSLTYEVLDSETLHAFKQAIEEIFMSQWSHCG